MKLFVIFSMIFVATTASAADEVKGVIEANISASDSGREFVIRLPGKGEGAPNSFISDVFISRLKSALPYKGDEFSCEEIHDVGGACVRMAPYKIIPIAKATKEFPCENIFSNGYCMRRDPEGKEIIGRHFRKDITTAHKVTHLLPEILKNTRDWESMEELRDFMTEGGGVDARDKYGNTPLHYVANMDSVPSVKFLIESDADVNALNSKMKTPLDMARDAEVSAYLRENGAKSSKFILSSQ